MPESNDHFAGRHYEAKHTTGPLSALNPTTRYLSIDNSSTDRTSAKHPGAVYVWRSRDNRKGRHAIAINPEQHEQGQVSGATPTDTWHQTLRGLAKMVLRYPVWDVSYDVAAVFTIGKSAVKLESLTHLKLNHLGSMIWVINGFFSWLPLAAPSTEFSGESDWGGGLTAFIGATVFEFGSILLMLEAVNENRSDCFGWAVEEELGGLLRLRTESQCQHSHAHKRSFLKGRSETDAPDSNKTSKQTRTWSWWPTWYELRTHYFRDIGFLACSSQMFGATIFWISGFTALPPILNGFSLRAENGAYWAPQVIGGTGFIVSSALFMLEVQPRWYIPAPRVLGWHIGLWNLVGAVGFTLCGALGFGSSDPAVEYALTLSTFIGSWAFLVSSAGGTLARDFGLRRT